MKQATETNLSATPFAVTWPVQLDIKPVLELAVSRGVTLRIFEAPYEYSETRDGKENTVKATGYVLRYTSNKTGQLPRALQEPLPLQQGTQADLAGGAVSYRGSHRFADTDQEAIQGRI